MLLEVGSNAFKNNDFWHDTSACKLLLYGTHNHDQVKYVKQILKSKCGPLNKDEEALQFLECKGKKLISLWTRNNFKRKEVRLIPITS
jgi:hypothetical protein